MAAWLFVGANVDCLEWSLCLPANTYLRLCICCLFSPEVMVVLFQCAVQILFSLSTDTLYVLRVSWFLSLSPQKSWILSAAVVFCFYCSWDFLWVPCLSSISWGIAYIVFSNFIWTICVLINISHYIVTATLMVERETHSSLGSSLIYTLNISVKEMFSSFPLNPIFSLNWMIVFLRKLSMLLLLLSIQNLNAPLFLMPSFSEKLLQRFSCCKGTILHLWGTLSLLC